MAYEHEQSYVISRYANNMACGVIVSKPKNYDPNGTKLHPVLVEYHGQDEFSSSNKRVHIPNLANSQNPTYLRLAGHAAAEDLSDFILISIQGGNTGNYLTTEKTPYIPIVEVTAIVLGLINPRLDITLSPSEYTEDSRFPAMVKNSNLFKTLRYDRDRIGMTAISAGGFAKDTVLLTIKELCNSFGVSIPDYTFASSSGLSALNGLRNYYQGYQAPNGTPSVYKEYPLTAYNQHPPALFQHQSGDNRVNYNYSAQEHQYEMPIAKSQYPGYKCDIHYAFIGSGNYHGGWYEAIQKKEFAIFHKFSRTQMNLPSANADPVNFNSFKKPVSAGFRNATFGICIQPHNYAYQNYSVGYYYDSNGNLKKNDNEPEGTDSNYAYTYNQAVINTLNQFYHSRMWFPQRLYVKYYNNQKNYDVWAARRLMRKQKEITNGGTPTLIFFCLPDYRRDEYRANGIQVGDVGDYMAVPYAFRNNLLNPAAWQDFRENAVHLVTNCFEDGWIIQVDNEPDGGADRSPRRDMTPAETYIMCKTVYDGIKAARPGVIVCAPGLYKSPKFLRDMVDYGKSINGANWKFCDMVDAHIYPFQNETLATRRSRMRDWKDAADYAEVPLKLGETGINSPEAGPSFYTASTEPVKTQVTEETLSLAYDAGIDTVQLYEAVDEAAVGQNNTGAFNNTGVRTSQGEKPVMQSYRTYNAAVANPPANTPPNMVVTFPSSVLEDTPFEVKIEGTDPLGKPLTSTLIYESGLNFPPATQSGGATLISSQKPPLVSSDQNTVWQAKLRTNDGGTAFREITRPITITIRNAVATVSAGVNRTVTYPAGGALEVLLSGTVNDPNSEFASYQWNIVGGTASGNTLANAGSLTNAKAIISKAGTTIIRITATRQNSSTETSEMTITSSQEQAAESVYKPGDYDYMAEGYNVFW